MKELTPYLNFDGNCREAMTFYAKCLGAELSMTPASEEHCGEALAKTGWIMNAMLTKGSPILMASDTEPGRQFQPAAGFSIVIACESLEEIQRLFAEMGENGTVTMPLQDMFWGGHFGMLVDQFGIKWMFNFDRPKPA